METAKGIPRRGGLYLSPGERRRLAQERRQWQRQRCCRRALTLTALILADGVLIYMLVQLFIHQIFGIVFVTVVSVCIGYELKGE